VTAYPSLGFDPAPGDATTLQQVASAWTRLGAELAEQADGVDAVRTGLLWQGAAAAACVARLHVVPADLRAAADACASAGRSIAAYADELHALQGAATTLEARASQQVTTARSAARDEDAQSAQRQLAALVREAWAVRDRAESHARDVARVLAAARVGAPHPPGWFHRMLHDLGSDLHAVAHELHDTVVRLAPQIEAFAAWCSKAASALAEVGFFVSLVPGVGDVVGAPLLAVSIALAASATAGHAALAAVGRSSWRAVAFDGAALTVALVSKSFEAPIEAETEAGAEAAAAAPAPWRQLPSMDQREFVLRAVRLHVDGGAAALGAVDLARLPEDWTLMNGRRVARASAA
jgi:hypothetical protein